jgi:hypothetical protein
MADVAYPERLSGIGGRYAPGDDQARQQGLRRIRGESVRLASCTTAAIAIGAGIAEGGAHRR